MGYGQQSSSDTSPDDINEKYLRAKYGSQQNEMNDLVQQSNQMTSVANQAGTLTDTESLGDSVKSALKPTPEFQKGAARGASGGLGSMLMSGGIASGNPYAIGGGIALTALEGDAQAKQAEEEARAVEAQQRKQAQLSAINQLIGVSKGLSVM